MSAAVIGRSLARVDGRAKVTGTARYAADFNQPRQAHAVLAHSAIGAGRIASIDDRDTLDCPGVLAVMTHLNAPKLPYQPHKVPPLDPSMGERLHVLQDERIRFFGQPVAVVVAETLDQAERAAERLHIGYEAQQPVVDLEDHHAATVHPEEGPGSPPDAQRGDAERALTQAACKVDGHYAIARENHTPMEPHATVAVWEDEQLTLWTKSQFVVGERDEIAAIFGLQPQQVRVICPFVGGAFGSALRTWPHVTLAALAARQVGRPVKLVLTRRQMFHEVGYRPRTIQRVALGASKEGKLISLIHEAVGETSRYEEFVEGVTRASAFMYSCANVTTGYRLRPLDVSTPTHMRAPGEASGIFALESAMDELAYALKIDPVELRRRNEPALDESRAKPFSSRQLVKCFEEGMRRFGWSARNPAPRSMGDGRLLVGWGTAACAYPALQAPASARVRVQPDGSVEVETSASDMGPGTYTSLTQVAAEALAVPVERVRLALGDTGFPPAPPHGGSMTLASVGSAVRAACIEARQRMAHASKAQVTGQLIEVQASACRPEEIEKQYSLHAFGAVFADVSVDPDVGIIRVRRLLGVYDVGRLINPRLAHSQCIGGMVGGIGMALMERTLLDESDGRPVNAHMADYLVPVSLDIDQLEASFLEQADLRANPLGAKGVGEIALVGVAPAIANAVFHATGRRARRLPIRIEDML